MHEYEKIKNKNNSSNNCNTPLEDKPVPTYGPHPLPATLHKNHNNNNNNNNNNNKNDEKENVIIIRTDSEITKANYSIPNYDPTNGISYCSQSGLLTDTSTLFNYPAPGISKSRSHHPLSAKLYTAIPIYQISGGKQPLYCSVDEHGNYKYYVARI
jgi:hypothetical protein